jgi:hypothetical protein
MTEYATFLKTDQEKDLNTFGVRRGKERLPARAHVIDLTVNSLQARDRDGNPIEAPAWYALALHPAGNWVNYALGCGAADIPARPLWRQAPGSYAYERMAKSYACGFLIPENGCLAKQLSMSKYGIHLVRPSRIVARELLTRPECVGECSCFEIEAQARRSRHNETQRESQAEHDMKNPAVRSEQTLDQLKEAVLLLTKNAVDAAQKKSKR